MKHARFFSLLVPVVVLGYGAVGFHFLPLASFQGDLTRTGMLPEALFGWTKPQPAIEAKWLQQASMREADVLVVGDSFSLDYTWQSVLTQHGLKVRTESWDSMRGISEDFMPWLHRQGFKGKYVVIEIVERNIVNVMARSMEIKQMQYHPNINSDRPHSSGTASALPKRDDYSGRFSIGIQTGLNVLKYEREGSLSGFSGMILANETKLARVKNGCELFSHARCNDALFFTRDLAEDVPSSAVENIVKLNARLYGVAPIWAFVPNKSTTYLYHDKKFWDEAGRRIHAPNLLSMTQQAIDKRVIDLYPANNSHFSTAGYLLMGEAIFKAMQKTQELR